MNSSTAQIASDMIHPPCLVSPSTSVSQEPTGIVPQDCSPSKAALGATGNSSLPFLQDAACESQRDGSESSDGGSNAVKKVVWNKPNGALEAGPVMGALSWPALSESTKASLKSTSYDSFKSPSDAPASLSKGTPIASSSSPKHVHTHNTTSNSTANHVHTRHRSNKRTGGNSSNSALANGSITQPHPLHSSVVESAPHSVGKSSVESYSRDNVHKEGGQMGGFGPQSLGGNEQHYMRTSPRKGVNSRPRPRGDGSYHQERGNQDWNHNRSFGSRDAQLHPLRVPARPFLRAPPPSPPFIPPLIPMRPLGSPMVYPEVPPPMYYVPGPHPDSPAMPMLPSPPPGVPMFYHVPDPMLLSKIVNQIDYYFSSENLIKDMYLRKEMDEQGWVPVKLIAGFKKVTELTDDIQLILHALRSSSVVEVQGEKLRARNDWRRWILPPSVHYAAISSPRAAVQSSGSDVLRQHLQSVKLDDHHSNGEPYLSRSSIPAQGIAAGSSSRS